MIKSDIPSTGSNSMEIFANDIEDFYSSSTVIYTPNNNTWNEIDNIVNDYNQLLIDSASLVTQLDFLRAQLNTNIDNIVPINNGSFENWTTGSIDDWMVSSASYLQVQGYSSSTAIRVIRNTPTSE
jgi:hypothetical protein